MTARTVESPTLARYYRQKRGFSEETARIVPNMKLWITNEYEQTGLRADGGVIVDGLLRIVRDEI